MLKNAGKALVVIQARSGSKRLPGKVLLPIDGVPMIVYLIRRLKILPSSYTIVLATTENAEDDILAGMAESEHIAVVRGEVDDVLSRFIRCMSCFPSDVVVRVTGDNPLTDPEAIKGVTELVRNKGNDYAKGAKGFPVGIGADAFTARVMLELDSKAVSAREREHINAYILDHADEFKIGELPAIYSKDSSHIRLTVDTQDDYAFMKQMIESFPHNHFIEIEDAIGQISKKNIRREITA